MQKQARPASQKLARPLSQNTIQFHKTSSVSSMSSTHSEGTLHMREILTKTSPLRGAFEEFVKAKYAGESLLLYDACLNFQQVAKNPDLDEAAKQAQMNELGKEIAKEFFAKEASHAVDVPGGLRTALLNSAEKGVFQKHSFDPVCALAFNDLKDNFFFQFCKVTGLEEEEV
jgi:hypothetical protein